MVAERIKSLREQNGMTQAALARKLNVTRSSVNAWEMGIAVPSTAILIEIAQLFHVSTDFLLGLQDTATLDVSELNDSEILLLEKLASYFRSTRNV
ncbi:MAG: helix-turn-helix transcriptional regulator [Monoglobales bacterium]|uniref:helix-turn-helix transcriptional regulator n=1 Tax=Candidatus Ventrimonas sp. TaxID=3048889 RepID=UPI003A456770